MHPFFRAVWLALLLPLSAHAGFTLRLQEKELQADTPDQTVDLYLKSTFDAQINTIVIGAFIGSNQDVIAYGGLSPAVFRDNEGNFQTNVFSRGVEWSGGGYFWDGQPADAYESNYWGHNVSQVILQFPTPSRQPIEYRVLPAGDANEVKIATFHLDTTGVFSSNLKLSLYDPSGSLVFVPETSVITADGTSYSITDPNQLVLFDGDAEPFSTTLNIASTPEPAVIGFAGLGLTAGLGWLRARRSKRKSAS